MNALGKSRLYYIFNLHSYARQRASLAFLFQLMESPRLRDAWLGLIN